MRFRRRPSDFGYSAFISYSGDRDRELIPQIQSGVEKLARPWYRPPVVRIFLDKTSISAGSTLWSKIEEGLCRSAWLILMASPEAAASRWVDQEIEWWLRHRSVDHLLLVVTDGALHWDTHADDFDADLSTALPPRLTGQFVDQPVWVPVVWHDIEGQRIPDLERITLDIASVVRGIPKYELASLALREHKRTMRWAGAAAVGLAVLLVATLVGGSIAVVQRNNARDQGQTAAHNRDVAVSRLAAVGAERVRGVDPALAQQLALAGYRIAPTAESGQALLAGAGAPRRTVIGPDPVTTAITDDGAVLAVAYRDGAIRIVERTRPRDRTMPTLAAAGSVTAVAFRPHTRYLAVGTKIGVALWDTEHVVRSPAPLPGVSEVNALAWSPDGTELAAATDGGVVRLALGPGTEAVARAQPVEAGPSLSAVAYSRDGQFIAAGGPTGEVRVAQRAQPLSYTAIAPNHQPIHAIAFDPEHNLAVLAGAEILPISSRTQRFYGDDPAEPGGLLGGQAGEADDGVTAFALGAGRPSTGEQSLLAGHRKGRVYESVGKVVPDPPAAAGFGSSGDGSSTTSGLPGPSRVVSIHVVDHDTTAVVVYAGGIVLEWSTTMAATAIRPSAEADVDKVVATLCEDPASTITAAEWAAYLPDVAFRDPCR